MFIDDSRIKTLDFRKATLILDWDQRGWKPGLYKTSEWIQLNNLPGIQIKELQNWPESMDSVRRLGHIIKYAFDYN